MSLCQPNSRFSCGACCGSFNLKLGKAELRELFSERTDDFRKTADFSKIWTLSDFRKRRESIEEKFERNDPTTYNCPFLGFIDDLNQKIGCLVHPYASKDPRSQNVSFYGASICQGYDCRNKEGKNSEHWENFLRGLNLSFYEYTLFAADPVVLPALERFFEYCCIDFVSALKNHSDLIERLLYRKIELGKAALIYITSFEAFWKKDFEGNPFQELCFLMEIREEDKMYTDLQSLQTK